MQKEALICYLNKLLEVLLLYSSTLLTALLCFFKAVFLSLFFFLFSSDNFQIKFLENSIEINELVITTNLTIINFSDNQSHYV